MTSATVAASADRETVRIRLSDEIDLANASTVEEFQVSAGSPGPRSPQHPGLLVHRWSVGHGQEVLIKNGGRIGTTLWPQRSQQSMAGSPDLSIDEQPMLLCQVRACCCRARRHSATARTRSGCPTSDKPGHTAHRRLRRCGVQRRNAARTGLLAAIPRPVR